MLLWLCDLAFGQCFLIVMRMVCNYTEPISANQVLSKNSSVNNYRSEEAIPQIPLIYSEVPDGHKKSFDGSTLNNQCHAVLI